MFHDKKMADQYESEDDFGSDQKITKKCVLCVCDIIR